MGQEKEKRFLAIDTASSRLQVALHTGRCFVCEDAHAASEALMPNLDRLLREEGLGLHDLDYIACVTGPGSFTGIRIGVSSVRALCYAVHIPALSLHALRVLAYNEMADGKNALCLSDASNGLVYAQSFDVNRTPIAPCAVLSVADAITQAKAFDGAVCADSMLCARIAGALPPCRDAQSLVRAARLNGCEAGDYNNLLPQYVRLSQAEQAYADKQRNA
ncbi:MAG: tRNA (adenosine(37)-N6)-threonylcarbamoyltransferase complex dimerization subunit type 1 TsaB [Clostridiales bacterium]|nr:tRNA (adenosine(37)-N6)-threonylcarbamoyltransferase complex dimerization subunit type 1 TsaB [Clostridiales bacterium]